MSLQPTSATKDLGGKDSLILHLHNNIPGHLVAPDAGTAEAAVAVLAGGVVAAVGQGVCRVPAALQLTTLDIPGPQQHLGSVHSSMSTHFLSVPLPVHSCPSSQSASVSQPYSSWPHLKLGPTQCRLDTQGGSNLK